MNCLKLISLFFFLCLFAEVHGQASHKISQIVLVPVGTSKLIINVPNNQLEILKTKGTRISVEIAVRLNKGSFPLLEYLAENGRYQIKVQEDGLTKELRLSPNTKKNVLLVKGSECEEIITYKIHIPEYIKEIETLNSDQGNLAPHQ